MTDQNNLTSQVLPCLTAIMEKLDSISSEQSRLSARIANIEELLCPRTIDNNVSNVSQVIKYPSPCNSKKKNEKNNMEFLESICLNEEQVKLFRMQLLSESRTVCSVLKMKKPATRILPFGKLDEDDKKQMVDLVTAALISYNSLFSELKYAARCWPIYFSVQSSWTNSTSYNRLKWSIFFL